MRKLKHAEIERPSLSDLSAMERFPIAILLHDIRSAHNVGSILRTADAIRADHVYLTGVSPRADNGKVLKTALGAEESVSWSHAVSSVETAGRLKDAGYTLVALEQTDSPTPIEILGDDIFPICLMVGNEVSGLDDELIALANYAIEIPQYGVKQSLNVSVAAGIALYSLLRFYLAAAP